METGKSHWRDNLARDLARGFDQVLLVCTNDRAYLQIDAAVRKGVAADGTEVRVMRAQDFCL